MQRGSQFKNNNVCIILTSKKRDIFAFNYFYFVHTLLFLKGALIWVNFEVKKKLGVSGKRFFPHNCSLDKMTELAAKAMLIYQNFDDVTRCCRLSIMEHTTVECLKKRKIESDAKRLTKETCGKPNQKEIVETIIKKSLWYIENGGNDQIMDKRMQLSCFLQIAGSIRHVFRECSKVWTLYKIFMEGEIADYFIYQNKAKIIVLRKMSNIYNLYYDFNVICTIEEFVDVLYPLGICFIIIDFVGTNYEFGSDEIKQKRGQMYYILKNSPSCIIESKRLKFFLIMTIKQSFLIKLLHEAIQKPTYKFRTNEIIEKIIKGLLYVYMEEEGNLERLAKRDHYVMVDYKFMIAIALFCVIAKLKEISRVTVYRWATFKCFTPNYENVGLKQRIKKIKKL
ncbi:hypothetical protein RFI_24540 [Reticulomyxa filosa]|uniref:Uncharacterized protein n=1 Tax=Reticulomyxa filosa TaxID=46433 RepID=X6MG16_RETFI|nr:hypothetical protein RFI_24540 [Reticulomyxa filosa]|eukprot:ETO12834.1 hypothetical protein RFI_24540 [Reticulomyxa filosa]